MARPLLWRITGSDRADTAFTGKGAARYPGRWNEKGTPLVYTAESLAGAMAELLAYFKDIRSLETRVYFRARVEEDSILALDPRALPGNWRVYPYPFSTQRIGTAWYNEAASVGLRVPSVLIPETYNVLLNPDHPDFGRAVEIEGPFPLRVDGRLEELLEHAAQYPGGQMKG